MITESAVWKALKPTLDTITTDDLQKKQICIGKGKLFTIESMKDGYADDVESAGTTLLQEVAPGEPMPAEDIIVGGTKRYLPKRMAKKVSITEAAIEDCKYEELLAPSKRLMASVYKTQDVDAASVIINSTSVVGGYDNVVLASTSHVLVSGGTESNCLNAGAWMTPSVQALIQASSMAALLKDPNGLPGAVTMEAIVCPELQRNLWKVILGSTNLPGTNHNDLNVVKDMGLNLLPIKWLDASSTNQWGIKTDAENGFRFLMRAKPKSKTWVDPDGEVAHHGVSYRFDVGWSNWRAWIQGAV